MQEECVKIASLELENVKKVKAVAIHPAATGLTTIGGRNKQGKSSILDAICFALGGEKYRPSNLQREGSSAEANMRVVLSNGLTVERNGKNASLKVTDSNGMKSGQKLLDSFIEELALNLPKFMAMKDADKGKVLLSIMGIEDQLAVIDDEEKAAYDERTVQGRIADQKEKYAAEMPEWHDVPEAPVAPAELVAASQAIMSRNAERQAMRRNIDQLRRKAEASDDLVRRKMDRVDELKKMLAQAEADYDQANEDAKAAYAEASAAAKTTIDDDESTADIERRMAEIEETNSKIRANLDKRKAIEDAENCRQAVDMLTVKLEEIRAKRAQLLDSVAMPLPGLVVEAGILKYNGQAWDCMSGMERIRVAAAIVRKRKPSCGFILLDGLEAMDTQELSTLAAWLEAENLQAIATRVSTGSECTIIIEDGLVAGAVAGSEEKTVKVEMEW